MKIMWMRTVACLAAVVAVGSRGLAQPWAKAALERSSRHQEWVQVEHAGRKVACFVVYPEVSGKVPAVLLIHEIYGLSDWAKEMADEVAAAGYVAIMPDLLSGAGAKGGGTAEVDPSKVIKLVSGLPGPQVMADLDAAADYIKQQPACSGKLFVGGFCWGGGKSFAYATHRRDLSAAFVFYGQPPAKDRLADVGCPVYGFYAGNDARTSLTVPDTAAAMKAAGKSYESVVYPGAGHGFMRTGDDPNATAPNKAARDQAWTKVKALLQM